jgi:hypothetical protein
MACIIRMIKTRSMRWARTCSTNGEKSNAYRGFGDFKIQYYKCTEINIIVNCGFQNFGVCLN